MEGGGRRSELNGTESHEMNADISISESAVEPNLIFRSPPYNTGVHFMVRSRFREYEVKKLRSPACSRQENAIFPCHIHGTWSAP